MIYHLIDSTYVESWVQLIRYREIPLGVINMIISISRRTEIPAFYTEWLINRFHEGYVLVRNPMNYHQVSKVKLTPDIIDCIVFWTKDPENIIDKLDFFSKYKYYFQITINPYDTQIEKGVRPKNEIIKSVKLLSQKIGMDKIVWRYDPIFLTDQYTIDYHEKYFELLLKQLSKYTNKCIISFMNIYAKTKRNMKDINVLEITDEAMHTIAKKFSVIGKRYEMTIETCSEAIDLSEYGINHGKCIDDRLISKICDSELTIEKDKNQRDSCGCVKSIDIGAYNTCKHNCSYCYANFSEQSMKNNILKHDPNSPFLVGNIEEKDSITVRVMDKYIKSHQQLKLEL